MLRSIASHPRAPSTHAAESSSSTSTPAPSRPARAHACWLTACLPSRRAPEPSAPPPRSTSPFTSLPVLVHEKIAASSTLRDSASVALTHHALYHHPVYSPRVEAQRLAKLPHTSAALRDVFARAERLPADVRSELHAELARQAASGASPMAFSTLSLILPALKKTPPPHNGRLLAATASLLQHAPQRSLPAIFERLLQYAGQADASDRGAVLVALARQIRHSDDFVRGEDINDYYFTGEPLPPPEALLDKHHLRYDKFSKLLAAAAHLPTELRQPPLAALAAAVRHLPQPQQRDAAQASLALVSAGLPQPHTLALT